MKHLLSCAGCRGQNDHCTANGDNYEHGGIRVLGINTTSIVAGRMLICHNGEWREVCHDGWDQNNARVVCHQLGFDPQGTALVYGLFILYFYIP